MKILVYGATGSQQFPVIASLLSRGAEVFAVTHTPAKFGLLQSAGATPVLADLGDLSRLHEISKGIDVVSLLVPFFVSSPTVAIEYAKNVISAAKNSGVKLLVWNSSGFIPTQRIGNPAIDLRIDIKDYLQESTLPSIILEPSVYMENLLGPWTAPYIRSKNMLAYPTPSDMAIGWIGTENVAELVAEAAFHSELAGNSYQISGLENVNGEQLANEFSKALERPIKYYAMPPKEFGKILDDTFGVGAGAGAEAMYQQIIDTKQYPVLYVEGMQEVLQALPVKMTSVYEWVSQNRQLFSM